MAIKSTSLYGLRAETAVESDEFVNCEINCRRLQIGNLPLFFLLARPLCESFSSTRTPRSSFITWSGSQKATERWKYPIERSKYKAADCARKRANTCNTSPSIDTQSQVSVGADFSKPFSSLASFVRFFSIRQNDRHTHLSEIVWAVNIFLERRGAQVTIGADRKQSVQRKIRWKIRGKPSSGKLLENVKKVVDDKKKFMKWQ